MELAAGLAAVVVLVGLHAFFVFAEFALVAVDRGRVEQAARDGERRARGVLAALKTLSFQLSGAQLGITLTSLVVGFLAEPTIGHALEPLLGAIPLVPEGSSAAVAVALALMIATAVEMVAAELIPKNIAIARPLETAFAIAAPLRVYNKLFKPLILFLNSAANLSVRLLGIEPREELRSVRSLEELGLLIETSRASGALAQDEASLLARSITFGDKTAADALVPRTAMVALSERDTLAQLAEVALESGHSRFPVYRTDLDDVVGIAHVKDTYRYAVEERLDVPVGAIAQQTLVVPESKPLHSLLLEMRREGRQMGIVVDEYGGTAGLITLEDILEEIVGEIEDEYDLRDRVTRLTPSPSGIHLVSGLLHPHEVRDQTGFIVPDGDYETLAGFLLSLLGRIPKQGDHVSYGSWEFKVVEMERFRIVKVLMVGAPAAGDEAAS